MPRFSLERSSYDGLSFFKPNIPKPRMRRYTACGALLYLREKAGQRGDNRWRMGLEEPREQPGSKKLGTSYGKGEFFGIAIERQT